MHVICVALTISHPTISASKPANSNQPKRESAATSGIGVCKRTVITRCDISPSPFFSCRASTLYLLRFLVILNAGLSLLEGRGPRLVPPAFFFSRPSRRTGRIYRWASSQESIATSQATYG